MDLEGFSWKAFLSVVAQCLESDFMRDMVKARNETESRSSLTGVDAATLYALVRLFKPVVILESGTYRGMSTSFLRQAQLDSGLKDGRVVTVDSRPERNLGLLIPPHLRDGVQQIVGGIRTVSLEGQLPPELDMFFHDSSHRIYNQMWEYETFWPRLVPGGLLATHDVDKSAAFPQFVSRTYSHGPDGLSDAATAHAVWGSIGKLGFMQKRDRFEGGVSK